MAANFTPEQLADIAYQQAHPDDNKGYMIIASCAVCYAVSVIAVGVRLWARRLARAGLGLDDYFIIAAVFFFAVISTSAIMTTVYGMGRHLIYVTNPKGLGITSILAESTYNFVVGCSRVSVLCFYGRLFPQKWFRITRWTIGSIIVAFCIAQFFTDIFQCVPIAKFWTPDMPGTCIDFWAGALAGTVFNVVSDFVLLGLPVPLIWNLKTDRKRRLQLIFAFTIGGIACIASIVRGSYTPVLYAFDTSWEFVSMVVATEVELMMFIVSACIPTYATILTRYRAQQAETSRRSMLPFAYATKRTTGTFELSQATTVQNKRWTNLNNESHTEDEDKQIMIRTDISTCSDHESKQEEYKKEYGV